MFSTTFIVLILSWNPEIGYVQLARRVKEENACVDKDHDVILPDLGMCLITLVGWFVL